MTFLRKTGQLLHSATLVLPEQDWG